MPKSRLASGRKARGTFHTVIFIDRSTFQRESAMYSSASFSTEEKDACRHENGSFDKCKKKSGEQKGEQNACSECNSSAADQTAEGKMTHICLCHLLSFRGSRG